MLITFDGAVATALLLVCLLQIIHAQTANLSSIPELTYFTQQEIANLLLINSSTVITKSSVANSTIRPPIWQELYWSGGFFNKTIGDKLRWTVCPSNATAVGLQCEGKRCERMTPICAHLKTAEGDVITWDRYGFPSTADGIPDVASLQYFGDNSGSISDPTANIFVPDRDMGLQSMFVGGIACLRSYCGLLGLYYSSIIQNFTYTARFMSPERNTSKSEPQYDSILESNPKVCSWTQSLNSEGTYNNTVLCPTNKLLTGLKCSGKSCRTLRLLCCPLLQAKPQDCIYTPFVSREGCKRLSLTGTDCTTAAGIEVLTRDVMYDGVDGGHLCDVTTLTNVQQCNPCYTSIASTLQTAYLIQNTTIAANASKALDYLNACACPMDLDSLSIAKCYDQCINNTLSLQG